MKLSDYNYNLPERLIAKQPPKNRGESRLLVLDRNDGIIADKYYYDVVSFLKPGDLLILNDSKVIKARLMVKKINGSISEIIILEKHGRDTNWYKHDILYKRKMSVGEELSVGDDVKLIVEEVYDGGLASVKSSHDLLEVAARYGEVPLPPYLHRKATDADTDRYQTVWAKQSGSVAAPTASLNMTTRILKELKGSDVKIAHITLHVGLGTFLPIRSDEIEKHHMHQEFFVIPADTIELIRQTKVNGGRVIALGTTVARTLEYASREIQNGSNSDLSGEADIFIYPGYKFKMIDGLLTNYHAPKSTVLMLAAAFAGWDNLLSAYKYAISKGYRFLSYGDSMLIL